MNKNSWKRHSQVAQITDSSFSSSRLKELPYRFAARIKHIESVAGWERQLELRNLRHGFFGTIFAEKFQRGFRNLSSFLTMSRSSRYLKALFQKYVSCQSKSFIVNLTTNLGLPKVFKRRSHKFPHVIRWTCALFGHHPSYPQLLMLYFSRRTRQLQLSITFWPLCHSGLSST